MTFKIFVGITAMLAAFNCRSQTSSLPENVEMIRKELAAMTNFSYNYVVKQSYPDGTTNVLKGQVTSSKDYYKEVSDVQTILQTNSWYYKVEFSSKTIYIINLDNVRAVSKKKITGQRMNILPDSLLSKYGKIKTNVDGKIVKLNISFGPDLLLKKVYLEYDTDAKLPKVYSIESDVLYDINKQTFEEVYIRQVLTAKDFTAKVKQVPVNLQDYFDYKGGKIILKKYSNFKLIQHI